MDAIQAALDKADGVMGAAEFRLGAGEIAEIERFRAPSASPVTA